VGDRKARHDDRQRTGAELTDDAIDCVKHLRTLVYTQESLTMRAHTTTRTIKPLAYTRTQITEQLDDSKVQLKAAHREIDSLKKRLEHKDAELQTNLENVKRNSDRMEEFARETADEQQDRVLALEHELSVAKHKLEEAQVCMRACIHHMNEPFCVHVFIPM
jgi:chromosome segregation ATPase